MAPCEHMLSNNNYGHQLINVLSDKFLCSTSSSTTTALNKLCVTAEVCFPPTTYIYNNNNQSVTKSHPSAFSSPFPIHHHPPPPKPTSSFIHNIAASYACSLYKPPSLPRVVFSWVSLYTFYDECIKLLFTAYFLYK